MQTNYPYTAEELAELMDDYHLNIVISIKKSHRADRFMKVLYTAGILNALYEDDATAKILWQEYSIRGHVKSVDGIIKLQLR